MNQKVGTQPDTKSAGTMILDFQAPELLEINICCLQAIQFLVFLLEPPEWTRTL